MVLSLSLIFWLFILNLCSTAGVQKDIMDWWLALVAFPSAYVRLSSPWLPSNSWMPHEKTWVPMVSLFHDMSDLSVAPSFRFLLWRSYIAFSICYFKCTSDFVLSLSRWQANALLPQSLAWTVLCCAAFLLLETWLMLLLLMLLLSSVHNGKS